MKRFFAILILLSLLALQACSSYSYKPVWYETSELMQSELPFSMINVQSPDIVRAVAYGVLDGKLGEIRYAVEVGGEGGRTAVLRVRKAETGYAENEGFIEAGGMTDGVMTPVSSERLGSAEVSYFADANSAAASYTLDDYSYALILTFDSADETAVREDIYNFVLAALSSGK